MNSLCMILVLATAGADGNLESSDSAVEVANSQFAAMKKSRDLLVSGVYRGVGTDFRPARDGVPEQKLPVEFSSAFDYDKNFLRFERLGPNWRTRHQVHPVQMEYEEQDRGVYVRRPDYSLHWSTEQPDTIYRRKPSAEPSRDYVSPLDVRMIGLYTNICFMEFIPFDQGPKSLLKNNILAAETSAEGVCRVVIQSRKYPDTFTTIWFDRKQGYSPIRYQHTIDSPTAQPFQYAETTWQKTSGVWVPQTYVGEDFLRKDGTLRRRMEITFEWESVNKPLPEEMFTAEGMGLPSTRIVREDTGD